MWLSLLHMTSISSIVGSAVGLGCTCPMMCCRISVPLYQVAPMAPSGLNHQGRQHDSQHSIPSTHQQQHNTDNSMIYVVPSNKHATMPPLPVLGVQWPSNWPPPVAQPLPQTPPTAQAQSMHSFPRLVAMPATTTTGPPPFVEEEVEATEDSVETLRDTQHMLHQILTILTERFGSPDVLFDDTYSANNKTTEELFVEPADSDPTPVEPPATSTMKPLPTSTVDSDIGLQSSEADELSAPLQTQHRPQYPSIRDRTNAFHRDQNHASPTSPTPILLLLFLAYYAHTVPILL